MKLKKGFVVYESDGDYIIVGTGDAHFSGMMKLNKTAAFIARQLERDITLDQAVDIVCQTYEVTSERARNDISDVLATLRRIGVLEE